MGLPDKNSQGVEVVLRNIPASFLVGLISVLLASQLLGLASYPQPIILPVIFAGAVLLYSKSIRIFGVLLIIGCFDYYLSSSIVDFSSDGVTYHHYAHTLISQNGFIPVIPNLDIRISANPTLPWLIASIPQMVLAFVADIENLTINSFGKLTCSFVLFLYALGSLLDRGKLKRCAVAAIIAFPAIFSSQLFSGYTDYFTYWAVSLFICSIFFMLTSPLRASHFEVACLSGCVLSVMKFQTMFFLLIASPVLIYILVLHRRKITEEIRNNSYTLGAVFFTTILISIIYFFSNFYHHGSLSPITSVNGAGNILFDNAFYRDTPRYLHFWHSLFSTPMLNPDGHQITMSLPNSKAQILQYGFPDLRFGAYGPFFPALFILFVGLFLYLKKTRFPMIYILALALLLPGIGVARYYSFVQAFIPIGCLFVYYRKIRWESIVIFAALASSVIVFVGSILAYRDNMNSFVDFTDSIKNEEGYFLFGGRSYYVGVIKERTGQDLSLLPKNAGATCDSIKRFYKVSLHDEILVCR